MKTHGRSQASTQTPCGFQHAPTGEATPSIQPGCPPEWQTNPRGSRARHCWLTSGVTFHLQKTSQLLRENQPPTSCTLSGGGIWSQNPITHSTETSQSPPGARSRTHLTQWYGQESERPGEIVLARSREFFFSCQRDFLEVQVGRHHLTLVSSGPQLHTWAKCLPCCWPLTLQVASQVSFYQPLGREGGREGGSLVLWGACPLASTPLQG